MANRFTAAALSMLIGTGCAVVPTRSSVHERYCTADLLCGRGYGCRLEPAVWRREWPTFEVLGLSLPVIAVAAERAEITRSEGPRHVDVPEVSYSFPRGIKDDLPVEYREFKKAGESYVVPAGSYRYFIIYVVQTEENREVCSSWSPAYTVPKFDMIHVEPSEE